MNIYALAPSTPGADEPSRGYPSSTAKGKERARDDSEQRPGTHDPEPTPRKGKKLKMSAADAGEVRWIVRHIRD